jgi:serine/threonine-protein phosphatase PGAM5
MDTLTRASRLPASSYTRPMASTLLYLVRHGEQQRAPGDGEDPGLGLSALGAEQAGQLGRRLALASVRFDVVRHSPARRAAETAAILSRYLPGVPVRESELLTDRTPVPIPGQEESVPAQYRWFLDTVPAQERDPGGARLDAAIARLAVTTGADRRELLVTHNFVIGWFVRHAMVAPWWRWMGLNQSNCGLTIIKVSDGEPPALVTFNDTGHLASASG